MAEKSSESKPFHLSGGSSKFSSRMSDVFGSFETIESKHAAQVKVWDENDPERHLTMKDNPEEDHDTFLVPTGVPVRSTADSRKGQDRRQDNRGHHPYKDDNSELSYRNKDQSSGHSPSRGQRHGRWRGQPRDPKKWKSYDLSTVSEDEMSDRSNASAAFSFLNDLRKQREEREAHESGEVDGVEKSDSDFDESRNLGHATNDYMKDEVPPPDGMQGHKFMFRKPVASETETVDKSNHVGGKYTMPEYVIGKGKHTSKSSSKSRPNAELSSEKISTKSNQTSLVSLSYLVDDLGDKDDASETTSSKVVFKKKGVSKGTLRRRHNDSDEDDD